MCLAEKPILLSNTCPDPDCEYSLFLIKKYLDVIRIKNTSKTVTKIKC